MKNRKIVSDQQENPGLGCGYSVIAKSDLQQYLAGWKGKKKKKKAVTALKITTFEVNSTKVLVATSKKLVLQRQRPTHWNQQVHLAQAACLVPFLLIITGTWIDTVSSKMHKDSSYWSSIAKLMYFPFWWPFQISSLLIITFALPNVNSLARSALPVACLPN